MKENHIEFCTSGNPWNEPNEQTITYGQLIKYQYRQIRNKIKRLNDAFSELGATARREHVSNVKRLNDALSELGAAARRDEHLRSIKKWKADNPGRKVPGSNRTARLRKKRRKALDQAFFFLWK